MDIRSLQDELAVTYASVNELKRNNHGGGGTKMASITKGIDKGDAYDQLSDRISLEVDTLRSEFVVFKQEQKQIDKRLEKFSDEMYEKIEKLTKTNQSAIALLSTDNKASNLDDPDAYKKRAL